MITQEDITIIVAAVLDALQTNGRTIAQLTPAQSVSEDDYFELDGGRKVSFATLRDKIAEACGGGGGGTVEYDGTDEVTNFSYAQSSGVITLKQKNRTSKTLTIPTATTTRRGLMTASDKNTLNNTALGLSSTTGVANEALAKATQAGNGLNGKTDKYAQLGMLKVEHWPDVMVYNIAPISPLDDTYATDWANIPVGSIYYEEGLVNNAPYRKLFVKTSPEQQGIVDLGEPREGTIYCHKGHGTMYVWDGSAGGVLGDWVQIGMYPGANGRLAYSLMAPMVLASMGRSLDGNALYYATVGDTYFNNGKIYYQKADNYTIDMGAPDSQMIFCNRITNKLYRWNGTEMVELG